MINYGEITYEEMLHLDKEYQIEWHQFHIARLCNELGRM